MNAGIAVPAENGSVGVNVEDPFPMDPVLNGGGTVGGASGTHFVATNFHPNDKASVVKTFDVHKNGNALCAIEIRYTDGSTAVEGQKSEDKKSITFNPGERVTFLGLYGNGRGTRCGGILLETDRGQKLEHVVDSKNNRYPSVIFSGIMAGAYGQVDGGELARLGLIFVKPINRISVQVNWRNLPGSNDGISSPVIAQNLIKNDGDKPADWTFNGQRSVTNSRTFTQSSTTTWGVSVEISAALFGLGVKQSASWSQAEQTSNAATYEESTTIGTTLSGILQPKEAILCTSKCVLGMLDLKYDSNVTIIVEDGTRFDYKEEGVFKNALYVNSETSYVPAKDAVVEICVD
ncbi:hypothetical protein K4K48_001442 [Colletotrichum sp. SAR 10_66]|nr:hypothetical protein K4K48_001442 [Colletotrichum sp. SAR 10_66]